VGATIAAKEENANKPSKLKIFKNAKLIMND
jgi:hypothetical protein